MSDQPDIIERTAQQVKNLTGKDWGADNIRETFPLFGIQKRAEALDQLDEHLRSIDAVPYSEGAVRKYARLVGLRRDLDHVHHNLRKVGR